jgi:copper chaperone
MRGSIAIVSESERQETRMLRFLVPDMTCSHCVAAITEAVKALDTGARVEAELGRRLVSVATAADPDPQDVSSAIAAVGYPNTQAA